MNRIKLAKELIKLAKELTAGEIQASVSQDELVEVARTFVRARHGLEEVVSLYDDYWSFGTSGDPALDDMMKFSSDMASKAKKMLTVLRKKELEWDREFAKRFND